MKPLLPVNLPRLSDDIEKQLLEIAAGYESFKYSRNTLGEKHQTAVATNDVETLITLESIKKLYGFDNLPQHRAQHVGPELTKQIEFTLGVSFPPNTGVFVQVVDCENTFIHTDGGSRKASFYYMLTDDSGAETRFYKSDKPPVYGTIWDPMDVYQFYSYTMQQHCWYTFSHDEIHSVNNVKRLRVGLLIDMTRAFPSYDKFVEHFECIM